VPHGRLKMPITLIRITCFARAVNSTPVRSASYLKRHLTKLIEPRHDKQESWFDGMESAFRAFGGVPREVLLDNARGLTLHHNSPRTANLHLRHRGATTLPAWQSTPAPLGRSSRTTTRSNQAKSRPLSATQANSQSSGCTYAPLNPPRPSWCVTLRAKLLCC